MGLLDTIEGQIRSGNFGEVARTGLAVHDVNEATDTDALRTAARNDPFDWATNPSQTIAVETFALGGDVEETAKKTPTYQAGKAAKDTADDVKGKIPDIPDLSELGLYAKAIVALAVIYVLGTLLNLNIDL